MRWTVQNASGLVDRIDAGDGDNDDGDDDNDGSATKEAFGQFRVLPCHDYVSIRGARV